MPQLNTTSEEMQHEVERFLRACQKYWPQKQHEKDQSPISETKNTTSHPLCKGTNPSTLAATSLAL